MELDIGRIDPNFLRGSQLNDQEFLWRNALVSPFEAGGLAVCEDNQLIRLPEELLPRCSAGVRDLAWHTAGGHVRFRTDAARIAVRAKSRFSGMMTHMPLTGSAGLDIYINGKFARVVRPADAGGDWMEGTVDNPMGMADVEVNMPLYNGLTRLLIGLSEGKTALPPAPYAIGAPIVYYGSSITQGGCASRPGNSYQGHLSRWLGADQINLGFSGNAKGEAEMAQYVSGLSMSAFVMDYDHNAPNVEHLRRTHRPFFETVRLARPLLPIVLVSRPDVEAAADSGQRREVVQETYRAARAAGDENVWFVGGETLFGEEDRDACTVDGTHPNDLGFYRMAMAIYPVLKRALGQA